MQHMKLALRLAAKGAGWISPNPGKIATAGGESQWLADEPVQTFGHRLRQHKQKRAGLKPAP